MFWIILITTLILLTGYGFFLSGKVIHPLVKSREEVLRVECDKGTMDMTAFNLLPREEVRIHSPYGYQLHGLFFPKDGSKKTVIICHGITCTIYNSVKYMEIFINRGFNVLIYDHRNHGDSGGSNTTFGYYEKYDLKACTDWVLERCGKDCVVGLHGESMGAATALQNAAVDPRIAFCIVDCPFSDLAELLKYRLKVEYGFPMFPAMELTRLFSWLRTGMRLMEISPMRDIANVDIPVFFIHGKEDRYVPPQMSIDMYNSKKGIKKLYLAPNSRHAESVVMNREEYDGLVGEFLEEVKRQQPRLV